MQKQRTITYKPKTYIFAKYLSKAQPRSNNHQKIKETVFRKPTPTNRTPKPIKIKTNLFKYNRDQPPISIQKPFSSKNNIQSSKKLTLNPKKIQQLKPIKRNRIFLAGISCKNNNKFKDRPLNTPEFKEKRNLKSDGLVVQTAKNSKGKKFEIEVEGKVNEMFPGYRFTETCKNKTNESNNNFFINRLTLNKINSPISSNHFTYYETNAENAKRKFDKKEDSLNLNKRSFTTKYSNSIRKIDLTNFNINKQTTDISRMYYTYPSFVHTWHLGQSRCA